VRLPGARCYTSGRDRGLSNRLQILPRHAFFQFDAAQEF
jgi:hypothetical protein